MAGVGGWSSFVENRTLAALPWTALREGDARRAMQGIDAYIADHFAFRPLLIYGVNWSKLQLGASSTPDVTLGKDRWMFLTDGSYYEDLRFAKSPAVTEWRARYIARQYWAERFGAHFVLVIAPQKETIYSEYLPTYTPQAGLQGRRSQYLNAMQDSGLDILDLTHSIQGAKNRGQLYYKYDTHWNFLGAYFGARAIINHLHALSSNVPGFSDHAFRLDPLLHQQQTFGDEGWFNLGVRIGVPFLEDTDTTIVPKRGWTTQLDITRERRRMLVYTFTKHDPTLPTLLVYADSFGYPLKQMIAEHFRRAVFVNPFEDEENPADEFPAEIVARERPDFVVYLRWEHAAFVPISNPPGVN
jgi:hypothetical protein